MDCLRHILLLAISVTSLWSSGSDGAQLNDYILDYQPLQFNPVHLHEKHNRVRRSVDTYLRWTFKAYGRTFNFQLEPAKSIFAPDHELVFGGEPPQKVDTSFIYEGHLTGIPDSSAHMSIINGSISGFVSIPGHTTYHFEPAKNYFKDPEFHTIIYPESRMNLDPYRHKRDASGTCGNKEIYARLAKMWQPVESSSQRRKREAYEESSPHNKYSASANNQPFWSRKKRDLRDGEKTCFMSLRADGILYQHILDKNNGDELKAKEEIISIFATHMKALNDIYTNTKFVRKDNPNVYFQGINFQLQRTTIMSDCSRVKPGYCSDNLDVSNFLDLTAEDNHDVFCLVHTFTYRDFVGGTLGLAWVATPNSRSSGVCGKYGRVRDTNNGISERSLNTGIVTLINFNQEVASRVSQLTFAHEVGHNFGAQHDTTDECAPYGTSQPGASDGNYIMFASATRGNQPNNAKFSSCSKDFIAKVLETVGAGKEYCFKSSNTAFCGNNIVEGTETCDCGYVEDCTDQCCNPNGGSGPACQKKDTAVCSPTSGSCCKADCTYVTAAIECQKETECTNSSSCLGAVCPPPANKPDYTTFCNKYTKVCEEGNCIGSVCQNIGWVECFLSSSESSSEEEMCYVSCKQTENSECISSFDEAKVNANQQFKSLLEELHTKRGSTSTSLGIQRPAGSACNDYRGYCDVFSKCRNVDAEGPFKQLTDLIFDPVTLKNIRTWIEDHWWAVLLMAVGVVVFMGVFIKIFEHNTPSKNPKRSRNSQPPPVANRRQGGRPRPQNDKRSDVYTTDVPMYDRGGAGYVNQGYQGGPSYNHGYQPPPNRGPKQFDRISEPRRY